MATLGFNDLKQYALPTYWDAGMLKQIELEAGYNYEQLINDIAAGLVEVNGTLLNDPTTADLLSLTTEASIEYPYGVSNGFEEATEYGVPTPKRAGTTGHMLPLIEYDRQMGWTFMFLKKARRSQIDADVASAVADVKNLWQQKALARLFKSTYDSVGTGRSMPVADAGTADAAYIPPQMPERASAFTSSHTHLGRLNGITQANLNTAVTHLWEHGQDAPFTLLVAEADIASWTAVATVTGYIPRAQAMIQYGTTQDLALVDAQYHGVVTTDHGPCILKSNARIPTAYWALYKSFGNGDARNPLVCRYNPAFGVGAVLLAGDHIRQYPLENAIMWAEMGFGIMNRVGAYVCYNYASGSYVDPTIS
jgi:hypothetical protein